MAFISWNSLWALWLMLPGEDVAEASGNHLLYTALMCSARNSISSISGNTPGEHLAIQVHQAMAVLGAWSWGWCCVQWMLGSLSTGRPLSILPQMARHPSVFPYLPNRNDNHSLSIWMSCEGGDRAIHWKAAAAEKCSNSISAEQKPKTAVTRVSTCCTSGWVMRVATNWEVEMCSVR